MTKFGETHQYKAFDFVRRIEDYLDRPVDGVICNIGKPDRDILNKYKKEKAEFIEIGRVEDWSGNRKIYRNDLLDTSNDIVRHDSEKLASLIRDILI